MTLQPLSNHVLVAPAEEEKVTKSGIVIPDTAQSKKRSRGSVIAIGPGKFSQAGTRTPMSVKVGDMVLFKEPWSDESKIKDADSGKEYLLVEEDDILAIIQ